MKNYDLHVHSTASDGTLTPKELIALALEKGLAGISITDHDTLDAYTDDVLNDNRIELIIGAEFSSVYEDVGVHILGYGLSITQPLLEFCKQHKQRRIERNQQIIALLKAHHMPLKSEDIHGLGRPHIAEAMIQKGYVSDYQEAFTKWIGDGRPCFTPGHRVSIPDTIAQIHAAGGKAVLAHPILLKKRSLIKKLLNFPFDGMECYYAGFSYKQNKEMAAIADALGGHYFNRVPVLPDMVVNAATGREPSHKPLQVSTA